MTYVYILRSTGQSGQLYIGVTNHTAKRLADHNEGKCLHTSKFRPWRMVYSEEFVEREDAFKRERQLKRWSRGKKQALINGNNATLKKLSRRRNK